MAARGHLKSIQGEQQQQSGGAYQLADIDAVEEYLGNVSDPIVRCRELGHPWPSSRDTEFSDVTPENIYIERTVCPRCGCACKVREWIAISLGRGKWRFKPLGPARTQYQRNKDGEIYTAPPGIGHIARRQIAESLVSAAFAGSGKSITQIKADARARGRAARSGAPRPERAAVAAR